MAEPKAPSASYLPGDDPEAIEANRRYQEALTLLNQSLDTRKNRLFDPTMLAMAQGFLTPGQTGSFGESLGNVAKNVGVAQEAESKREQEIAQQRLAVAGQGLELQRLKSRDAELSNYLNPTGPVAGPKAAPTAGPLSGALAGPKAALAPAATTATAAAPAGPLSQGALAAPAGGGLPAPSKADKDKQEDYDRMSRIVATFNTPEHKKKWMESYKASEEAFANEKKFYEDRLKNMPRPSAPAAAPEVKTIAPQAVTQGPLPTRDKPPGFEGVDGIQVAPPNPNFMSARDYVRLNRFDKSKSPGDLIKEGQEIEQKRYRDKEGGVLDLSTGKFYQYPTGKTEEVQLYGYPGTYSVDARTAARLSMLAANNDPAYYDLAKRVVEGPQKAEGKAGEPSRIKSKQELELDKQKAEKTQSTELEEEFATKKDFIQRGKDADDTITLANQFRKFSADPNASKMSGILNNDKISSGIATLIQGGVGAANFRVGVPEIENVMRNAGLSAADQAKYRTFLMYVAQMQLAQTKYMKGSVSNYEQQLMGSAGINAQDTPETIRMKADLMTRRAQFDRRVAKEFKNSKMTAGEFLDSDRYAEMRDKYNSDLADLSFGGKMLVEPTKPSAAPATDVNPPSPGYIKDPVTGINRRKVKGE